MAVHGISQGLKKGILGVGLAGLAHYFLNFPILLPAMGLKAYVSKTVWMSFLNIYIFVFFIWMWMLTWKRVFGRLPDWSKVLGKSTCPSCGTVFDPPLLTLSLGIGTGQRCPHCKKWHFYPWEFFKKK